MANRLSDEKRARLRQWFREHGTPRSTRDFKIAATEIGIDFRTARREWNTNIAVAIKQEQILARAELTKQAIKAERELAPDLSAKDAAGQIARETLIARGVSMEALYLVSQLARLRGPLKDLIGRVEQEPAGSLSAEAALERVDAISRIADRVVTLAAKSIQLERLRVGDPALVIGVKPMTDEPSLPQLEAEVLAAARGLARVRAQQQLEDGDVGEPQ